jgi:hypothetical protein
MKYFVIALISPRFQQKCRVGGGGTNSVDKASCAKLTVIQLSVVVTYISEAGFSVVKRFWCLNITIFERRIFTLVYKYQNFDNAFLVICDCTSGNRVCISIYSLQMIVMIFFKGVIAWIQKVPNNDQLSLVVTIIIDSPGSFTQIMR